MTQVLKTKSGQRIIVIAPEDEAKCELCHAVAELRPYGPNGENICITCGEKDRQMTTLRMMQHLMGTGFDA